MEVSTEANREYKDSVFTLLFGNKEKAAEVINAFEGTNYTPDQIEIMTLKHVLVRGRINDLSFLVDGRMIVLIEHQSTINPNIPFRMLEYATDNLDRLVDHKKMFGTEIQKIPYPEFMVLYNGVGKMEEDMRVLKLSDMFISPPANEPPALELTVKMYNINDGRNPELAKRSPTIDEYGKFVQKVRDYQKKKGMSLEEAMVRAVEDCINENILKDFLTFHKKEIVKMLPYELTIEDEVEVRSQEIARKHAKKMIAEGIDVDTIARVTGLTVDDVLRLK